LDCAKIGLKDPHELRSWVNELRWLSDNAEEPSSFPFRRLWRRNGREEGRVTNLVIAFKLIHPWLKAMAVYEGQ
jgi:hypothetical protein